MARKKGGGGAPKAVLPLLLLCACAGGGPDPSRAVAVSSVSAVLAWVPSPASGFRADDPVTLNGIAPAVGTETYRDAAPYYGAREQTPPRPAFRLKPTLSYKSGDCSLKDRFDRKETFAYEFAGGQSRLGLDIDIDGLSLGNPAPEFEGVKLQFRYKFQKPGRREKRHCRYESGFQGLVGSAYNELMLREDYTIWREMDDRGLYFWRD